MSTALQETPAFRDPSATELDTKSAAKHSIWYWQYKRKEKIKTFAGLLRSWHFKTKQNIFWPTISRSLSCSHWRQWQNSKSLQWEWNQRPNSSSDINDKANKSYHFRQKHEINLAQRNSRHGRDYCSTGFQIPFVYLSMIHSTNFLITFLRSAHLFYSCYQIKADMAAHKWSVLDMLLI